MQMDFSILTLAYCPLLLSPSFLCSIVSIAVPSKSCQLPNCDLFTSLALFIVFWERDITSENHGTPVHLHFIVHTTIYLSAFTFTSTFLSLALILCKRQGRRN